MIPAPFDYARAETVDHAIELLGESQEAKILAGGQSLLPLMRLRLARPPMLVDISRIADLSYVREGDGVVTIGALTRHHDLATSGLLQQSCPIIAYTAGEIGDPQVRHVGTIGGSLAHVDPAADLPAVLLALGAEMVVHGRGGVSRIVPADAFFRGLFESDLAQDEVLTEIRVPRSGDRGWSYLKYRRRAGDWALVGVAVVGGAGDRAPSVALTNMSGTPIRATAVEEALANGVAPAVAAERAAEGTSPPSDAFASAEYRRALVKVIARRALDEALSRAVGL